MGGTRENWHRPVMQLNPGLYVTATPIGNLKDITYRAVETLAAADLILCEDTRVTARLTRAHGIDTPLSAYHDHNAARVRPMVLERLAAGEAICLVSDAGTPLISDPGYKLVREAREAGHGVYTVPGASAATAALSIAGLATDRFLFAGFLPVKSGARRTALEALSGVGASLVFYETGPRLAACLADMAAVLGAREAAVARELTKLHEEVRRGTLADLAAVYGEDGAPKGEIVIVVGPPQAAEETQGDLETVLRMLMADHSLKDAVRVAAEQTGAPRKRLYDLALTLKQAPKQDGGA